MSCVQRIQRKKKHNYKRWGKRRDDASGRTEGIGYDLCRSKVQSRLRRIMLVNNAGRRGRFQTMCTLHPFIVLCQCSYGMHLRCRVFFSLQI